MRTVTIRKPGRRTRLRVSAVRKTVGLLLISLLLSLVGVVGGGGAAWATTYPDCGAVTLAGSSWMGGNGVDVRSNGVDTSTGVDCGSVVHNLNATPPQYGDGWQCVELAQRLYNTRGWYSGTFAGVGVAADIYSQAANNKLVGLTAQGNNAITSVVPGDLLVFSNGTGNAGHVGVVDTIGAPDSNGNVTLGIVNQNTPQVTYTVTWNKGTKAISVYSFMDSSWSIAGVVHATANSGSTAPPTTLNGSVTPMAGHWWSGDSGQDFAYVTKNSDGGFSLAIQEQTPTGLQWKGVVWTVPGSSGVQFNNTLFIPVDANQDGLLDLYYATSTNWSQPGFTIGYMQNTGSGLTYGGTKQTFSNLALSDVKFLAGKWSSSGGPAFAYVTRNSDNGFSVATFSADTSGNLTWQGVKWTQPGSSGVQFNNTTFTPIDATGTGVDDLLYSTSTSPSSPGFATAEMHNDGTNPFTWAGTKMTQSSLALNQVRFIPGHWDGPGREALAYVSQRSDGGFDLAVEGFDASGNTSWQGVWYSSSSVQYALTLFVPADTRSTGYTDLFYATASGGGSGFDMAVAYNNTGNSGLTYEGQQWDQTGLTLSQTMFLPQF